MKEKNSSRIFLVVAFLLISSLLISPILGLQSQHNILSEGLIVYPEHELGVFYVWSGATLPDEARWVVAKAPNYEKPRENISVILNWYILHPPSPFESESEIKEVEEKLKSVPTENFWGIIFICEEHYRVHIGFYDDVNTTWFGERLLGYPLYLQENPSATKDQWKDEMFLRMIRGFYNYFHEKTKVGITACAGSIVTNYRNQSWSKGWMHYFGESAMAFIRQHYDFIILYTYTQNLEDFQWTKQYFLMTDQLFQNQKRFWILTRIWDGKNDKTWEREAIALEMKNCLDRNIAITCYYWNDPPFEEAWALMLKSIELYDRKAPYCETPVYGKNLLTEYVGNTYGWVEVLE